MTDDDHPDTGAHTDPLEKIERPEPFEPTDHPAKATEPAAPPNRRWLAVRQASLRHPVSLPIGAGIAGLVLGAGLTAALFTSYAPAGEPSIEDVARPGMPPARFDHAPPPWAWPGRPNPHGVRPHDDPPPPPGWGPGAPPPPFGGPPPAPAWGPPPPGWGPGVPPPGQWGAPGPGGPATPPGPPA